MTIIFDGGFQYQLEAVMEWLIPYSIALWAIFTALQVGNRWIQSKIQVWACQKRGHKFVITCLDCDCIVKDGDSFYMDSRAWVGLPEEMKNWLNNVKNKYGPDDDKRDRNVEPLGSPGNG